MLALNPCVTLKPPRKLEPPGGTVSASATVIGQKRTLDMIEKDAMLSVVGVALIAFGVVASLLGDARVSTSRGTFSRILRWRPGKAKKLKLVIGLALIVAGMAILIR